MYFTSFRLIHMKISTVEMDMVNQGLKVSDKSNTNHTYLEMKKLLTDFLYTCEQLYSHQGKLNKFGRFAYDLPMAAILYSKNTFCWLYIPNMVYLSCCAHCA